ncbi:FG-GAP-like repeat-containing protein [Flavobacterium sp.]
MKLKNVMLKKNHRWLIFQIILIVVLFTWQDNYAQNTCAAALPISAGVHTINIIDGTNIQTTCSTPALAEWYAYTPTQNWNVTITSDLPQNVCKDTNFEVYTGNCGALVCFSGDDDSGVLPCNSGNSNTYLSKATFEVTAGTTYYINWNNQWNQTAGFDFELIEAAIVPNPCNTATPVTAGITIVNAIDVANVTTACSTASMAKWYRYTPTQNYQVTVTSDLAANICKDTNFSVYTGICTSLTCIASDDNSGVLQCNSGNTNSNLSTKTFLVNAGTTYYIAWDNKWSAAGFNFQIIEAVIPPPRITYNSQPMTTISSSYNLCIVDMNGDHKDDLVGISDNNLKIHYQNETPGTFSVVNFSVTGTSFMPSWSMAAGDYNKDGYNDLVLGSGSGLSLWRSNSSGTAYTNTTPGEYIFCQRTNFADLNNDGNLDVFSCHDIAPNVYYLNDGAGGMTYYQSNTTPGAMNLDSGGGNYATLFTDFDNDGDSDIFISKCSGPPCLMFRNDGGSNYTNVSATVGVNITPIQTWSSAIADFDNDGDMDIIITASANAHHFLRNNFETTNTLSAFTEVTLGSGWDTNSSTNIDNIAYDFDNDGFVDVMGGGNKIMFNQGDGTFIPTSYTAIGVGAVGDLNNDGFLDIQNGNTIRYAIPNANNWLKVTLNGIQSNSNGIGARIEIYGAWGKQIRDIRSGEGFKYMSSLNGHFGLGTATTIDQVIVKWPSGVIDTYNNVPVNSTLNTVEGATLSINNNTNTTFKVYPNPAQNTITIQHNSAALVALSKAEMYDLNGRLVLEKNMINEQTIEVQKLATGTYILLLVDTNANRYTQKIIKE